MRRRAVLALTFCGGLLLMPVSLAAADGKPSCRDGCVSEASGGEGVIDVTYTRGKSERVPGRGTVNDGYTDGKITWIQVEEEMAPTCAANTRTNQGGLCGPAINSCPDGLIRFWVWHQVTTFTKVGSTVTSAVTRPWYQEDGSFCLGADDPGVPNIAKVIDQVRTDFSSLPLRVPAPRADPAPRTLVNIHTAFSAGTSDPQTFDPVLLGTTVHVTAKPVRWVWTWGDSTQDAFDRPGTPRQPDVTHRYTRSGDRRVSVVVEWRGTFRVGSDPTEYTISTPAFVTAPLMTVRVREARSQLVR